MYIGERRGGMRQPEILAENQGYDEFAMLKTLERHPQAVGLLQAQGLVLSTEYGLHFPSYVSPEQERVDPQLADQAFKGRVGRHTTAVGITMHVLMSALKEAGMQKIENHTVTQSTEVMMLHDLMKFEEIRWRESLGSTDTAYNAAESELAYRLSQAGYDEGYVQLARSVGHNGARDFIADPALWTPIRQCAYLADELVQETTIQEHPLAKARRLMADIRYAETNKAGFPKMSFHPAFVLPNGIMRPKFDVQGEATGRMARNIGDTLGIEGKDLGKFLIKRAVESSAYRADLTPPVVHTKWGLSGSPFLE